MTRRLHALFGLCLAGIVALVTWNHAVWVSADGAPRLREDTLRHLERMLSQWQHLRHAPSAEAFWWADYYTPGGCLLYTSPSPRDLSTSRMPSSA